MTEGDNGGTTSIWHGAGRQQRRRSHRRRLKTREGVIVESV
jgi:hypothetical protein